VNLARYIDHTLLKPQAGKKEVERVCREAKDYGFASVCVLPYYVEKVAKELQGSQVKVGTVIGFPLGASFSSSKAAEVKMALSRGGEELDVVINFSALIDGDEDTLKKDLDRTMEVSEGKTVKAIIEACYLNQEQKIKATKTVMEAGAHYVKTSTGFGTGGAQEEDIKLMKEIVGERIKIKAAGGIKDRTRALKMIELGASRIGTSSGVALVEDE